MKTIFNKIIPCALMALSLTATSCSDWLDVRSELESKEENQFETAEGFKTALIGCYEELASQDIYGQRLTMTNSESLANLWEIVSRSNPSTTMQQELELADHNYTGDNAKTAMKTIYAGLFNTIVQANVILKNIDDNGSVIGETRLRNMIAGEAYALRALCQLDVLRLFGQVPQNATIKVSLPYSYMNELGDYPSYYDFDTYVKNLESDFAKAEELLKSSDPIMNTRIAYIDDDDDFFNNRRFRLNYWAVRGLHARMELYLGNKTQAYTMAKEIINEKVDDTNQFSLSGVSDLDKSTNAYTCPTEALFLLSEPDLMDYIPSTLIGQGSSGHTYSTESYYTISVDHLTSLYAGQNTASHNRYLYQWDKTLSGIFGESLACSKKYYYDSDVKSKLYAHAVIPMLRLSEIYLIAMETTTDLSEANSLYNTYMRDRNVLLDSAAFETLDDVKAMIIPEYRREFFAEGQMFYCYKRNIEKSPLWATRSLDEKDYIIPLPTSEYDPSSLKK